MDDSDSERAKALARELAARHPGKTIEVRIPPLVAVQICGPDGDGPTHRRGTPPNTIEMDPQTWLALASGELSWDQAVKDFRVLASGRLADLSWALPLEQPAL